MRGMPPPRRKDVASNSSRRRSAGLGTGTGRVARDAMTNAAFKKKKEGPTDASRRKGGFAPDQTAGIGIEIMQGMRNEGYHVSEQTHGVNDAEE